MKKLGALRDPKPETLEQWIERHRRVVRETLSIIGPWLPEATESTSSAPIFLDVGANVGLFTEELLKKHPGLCCHLFEPVERYFQACSERHAHSQGVSLWRLALSNQNESRPIYKAKHNPGANSVMPEIMFDRRANSMVSESTVVEEEMIECVRFSDWAPQHNLSEVAFIKIDTEGFDYAVLEGLLDFLQRTESLPPILTELLGADYHPRWKEQHAVLERLFELGYSRFPDTNLPKVGDVLLLPTARGQSFILPEESGPPHG